MFALYRPIYAVKWKTHNLTHRRFFRDNDDILKVSQQLEFYGTSHWKFKMRCPLAFEHKLGWTALLASRTPQKCISMGKRLKNDLEFHQTALWKFKMGCPFPFEYELGWTAFLASGTLQKWISTRKRLKNDFQGQSADLQHVKKIIPHTSQIRWHQLRVTPLLLDWSIMRNIHRVFKFLHYGRINLLNILPSIVYFSVA